MTKKFYMLLLCAVVLAALTSCKSQASPQETENMNSVPADTAFSPENNSDAPTDTPTDTPKEDEEIWDNLISEYFDMMETDDQDLILAYLLKAGPYGDERSIRGEHLTNYEVTKIEHSDAFYASMHDELEREIERTKRQLAEIKPDFNIVVIDFAAVYVQAEFENQDLGTVDYKFWFINNNGTWEMYYIDR